MSIILNEAGLRALLDTTESPVGAFVAKIADDVAKRAGGIAADYYGKAPTLGIEDDIAFSMDGSSAVVGYAPKGKSGTKSRILASKERDGSLVQPPLQTALKETRGGG